MFHVVLYLLIFFFVKQKTAYEMRISDWSSDVCSSDLLEPVARRLLLGIERDHAAKPFVCLSASASAMPAATATFKERKPGCIGKIGRASCRERVCQYV